MKIAVWFWRAALRTRNALLMSAVWLAFGAAAASAQIVLSPSSLPAATQSQFYSQSVTASGGTGPYTYAVTTGSLPTGLNLNGATGEISGTPTTNGISNFTITATDALTATGQRSYSLAVGTFSLTLLPTSLPNGTQGVAYNQTITAVGGTAPYTFSVSSGSLPTGLSMNANGDITGTPSAGGSFGFIIEATDTNGNSGFRPYTVNVAANSLTINPATLPNASQGTPYSQNITASGGAAPYTFTISSGSLPSGLSLASGGTLSGTPTVNGTFNFTVRGVDNNSDFGTRAYTLNVGANNLTVNPSTLPNGTTTVPYSQTVTASGGTGPYTYSVTSGSLPTSLSLDANTGAITGTPSAAGTYNFTIGAVDSVSNTGSRAYTVNIGTSSLTVNPASLPNGTVSTAYSQTVNASGGTAPYTYSISVGSLPTGLSLNGSNGAITGTPSAAGTYNFTVAAADSIGNTGTRAYSVTINIAPLTINPSSLPNGSVGTAYSQTVTASGGTAPYTYSVVSGSLPTGLSLNGANGQITGTPTTGGSYTFTVQATDTTPNTGTRSYTINIGTNSLTVNPATLPNAPMGRAYSQTVSATGGTAPYTYSVSVGSLPPGLSLNASSGAITGTPTTAGTYPFTIRAIDVNGNFGARAYSLNTNRIDPANDPEVRGLVTAQVMSAQRFASTQLENISRHLEMLHDGFEPCRVNFGIMPQNPQQPDLYGQYGYQNYGAQGQGNVPYGAPAAPGYGQRLNYTVEERGIRDAVSQIIPAPKDRAGTESFASATTAYQPYPAQQQPYGQPVYQQAPAQQVYAPVPQVYAPAAQAAYRVPQQRDCPNEWMTSVAAWTSGTMQFGTVTPNGLDGNRFISGGLTAGVDVRVQQYLIVGAAVGFGQDRSDIGSNGTRTDGSSLSGAIYASFGQLRPFFLDAIIGGGTLSFDNRRFITDEATFATGTRTGSFWFGAITASYEARIDRAKIVPYLRAEFSQVSLDQYAETAPSTTALTYDKMSVTSAGGAIGLRGSIDVPMAWGTLVPNARVEYRHMSNGGFSQSVYYSDLGSATASAFTQGGVPQGTVGVILGLRAKTWGGMCFELDYGATTGVDASYLVQSVRAAMRMPL